MDEPALKDRIAGLKSIRDQAQAEAERTAAALASNSHRTITPAMVRKFAATARERIRIAGGGYRRDHLRALTQRGEVRILGSKSNLLHTRSRVGRGRPRLAFAVLFRNGVPYGIRTRVANVKGWSPGPLDERDGAGGT